LQQAWGSGWISDPILEDQEPGVISEVDLLRKLKFTTLLGGIPGSIDDLVEGKIIPTINFTNSSCLFISLARGMGFHRAEDQAECLRLHIAQQVMRECGADCNPGDFPNYCNWRAAVEDMGYVDIDEHYENHAHDARLSGIGKSSEGAGLHELAAFSKICWGSKGFFSVKWCYRDTTLPSRPLRVAGSFGCGIQDAPVIHVLYCHGHVDLLVVNNGEHVSRFTQLPDEERSLQDLLSTPASVVLPPVPTPAPVLPAIPTHAYPPTPPVPIPAPPPPITTPVPSPLLTPVLTELPGYSSTTPVELTPPSQLIGRHVMRDFIVGANSTYEYFFGSILEVQSSQFDNLYKIQYSDNMIQNLPWSELREWLLPASFNPSNTKNILRTWRITFQIYASIHTRLSAPNCVITPTVFEDDYAFIKQVFRFSPPAGRSQADVCSSTSLKNKVGLLAQTLSAARTVGLDSKYRVMCAAVFSMLEYLTALRCHTDDPSAPMPPVRTLAQFPAFGSEAFLNLPGVKNPSLLLAPSIRGGALPAPVIPDPGDDDIDDSTPYVPHPQGHDLPLEAPNPSLLSPDGVLPNHWNAVDAFDLNGSLLSVFHYHLYVPGECVKAWALCLQKAAQTLIDTLESPAEGLLPRLRRALFWYAVLPQLLLRDVRGKKEAQKIQRDI